MEKYQDRREAGKILAESLKKYAHRKEVLILALPRGGVPVAFEIAQALQAPLDVFIVRKLGVPGHEELAMGALATGDVTVFNEDIVRQLNIPTSAMDQVIQEEKIELKRREKAYRDNRPFPSLENKIVILVDDGIATGATMRAAIQSLRLLKPQRIVITVPVAEKNTCQTMATLADEVICPMQPTMFYAVGAWYDHFDQTTDSEVKTLLAKSPLVQ